MTNVLFVCIGNSCRSQMAEGFARKYGSDVMRAWSAGLAPAPIVQPLTIDVMRRKNIDIYEQFPKSVNELELNAFEIVVNMSGTAIPVPFRAQLLYWDVMDPMLQTEEIYMQVRDQIEGLVMQLIMDLRRSKKLLMEKQEPESRVPVTPIAPVVPKAPNFPKTIAAGRLRPAGDGERGSDSSQKFGFGRVRRIRD